MLVVNASQIATYGEMTWNMLVRDLLGLSNLTVEFTNVSTNSKILEKSFQ